MTDVSTKTIEEQPESLTRSFYSADSHSNVLQFPYRNLTYRSSTFIYYVFHAIAHHVFNSGYCCNFSCLIHRFCDLAIFRTPDEGSRARIRRLDNIAKPSETKTVSLDIMAKVNSSFAGFFQSTLLLLLA